MFGIIGSVQNNKAVAVSDDTFQMSYTSRIVIRYTVSTMGNDKFHKVLLLLC